MKNILLIISVFFIAISCQTTEEQVDYVILSGKAINFEKHPKIRVENRLNGFTKEILINQDGAFLDTLFIKSGIYNVLSPGSYSPIYLNQGDKIVREESGANREVVEVKYSGSNASFNNYLFYKSKKASEYYRSSKDYHKLNEKDFLRTLETPQSDLENKINVIVNLSEGFLEIEMKDLTYMKYQRIQGYIRDKKSINTDFKASEALETSKVKIDLNDEKLYRYSQSYRGALLGYGYSRTQELNMSMGELLASSIDNEYIKNQELHSYIGKALRYETGKKAHYETFMKHSTNDNHKEEITAFYNEVKRLEPGEPSPKFENYTNYAGGTTSLDDLTGKFVYIDVWATWCGPCKAEIPFLEKVQEQYHNNNNITFLSLSVDKPKDKDKWETMIIEKNMGGLQLLADNEFKSDFVADFKIGAIPRFLMLDPEGKIVSIHAPRPSDPKLIDFFNELGI